VRRVDRPFREAWERRKRRAFPPGAVTFHIGAWSRGRLSPDAVADADEVRTRFGFDELFVVHGSAFLDGAGVTLVSGPPGIGKSSVLRELESEGRGRLVEDGVLLVGSRDGTWHLVVTGTLGILNRSSRIGGRVRDLMGVRYCLYQNASTKVLRKAHPLRSALLSRLPDAAFTLSVAFAPPPGRPFTPEVHEVRSLLVLPHAEDPAKALRLCRGGVASEVADVTTLAPPTVSVRLVSPLGELLEVRERLRRSILDGRTGDARSPA